MENRKVFMNQHNNLLELEEHMYPLVDVETPNIFRNLFPYDEIPKIAFNDRIVPHHMPDESGLPIRHSVMDSSRERLILQNRLSHCMIIFTDLVVRKERSASANFSYIVKKTGTQFTNVWREDTNFRR